MYQHIFIERRKPDAQGEALGSSGIFSMELGGEGSDDDGMCGRGK